MGEEQVPKNILTEILEKTLLEIDKNEDFDEDTVSQLKSTINKDTINTDDIILILKGDSP